MFQLGLTLEFPQPPTLPVHRLALPLNFPTPPHHPSPHTEGWPIWSILIVDDEEGMRNFLVKTLVPRCRTVMSAGSAEEGAQLLREQHVDLIILDISLPGRSGVVWLKELREHGFSGEVILITAFADLDTAIEALRAGASDFILKPFRVPQILNAVKHCYERASLARENFVLRRSLQARRPDGQPGGTLRADAPAAPGAAAHRQLQQHGAAAR